MTMVDTARKRLLVYAILGLGLATSPLAVPLFADQVAQPPTAESKEEEAKKEAEKKTQERIEKIKKLKFDRRPSALLGGVVELDGEGTAKQSESQETPEPDEAKDEDGSTTEKPAPDPFDKELEVFAGDVTAGRWEKVEVFLAALPEKEREAACDHILEALPKVDSEGGSNAPPEKPVFAAPDVVRIARALPVELTQKRQKMLATIARASLDSGVEPDDLVASLLAETKRDEKSRRLGPLDAGYVLAEAGRADLAAPFLPTVDDAVAGKDFAGLQLRVRCLRVGRARDSAAVSVDDLWNASRALLTIPPRTPEDRRYAVAQAIDLLPQLPRTTALEWMAKITSSDQKAGLEMVSAIAARVASGQQRQPREIDERTRWLELLRASIDGATTTKAVLDPSWREPLSLAARGWTAEAIHSAEHGTRDIGMRRDPYGNIYYWEQYQLEQDRERLPVWPVALSDAIATRPDAAWLDLVDPAERPAIWKAIARLYCKAGEPEKALPFLEVLAPLHPDSVRALVPTVLESWSMTHDPNDERVRQRQSFWYYGMDSRQSGIPLTRSLQQRNLTELTAFVKRLRALPLPPRQADGPSVDWIDEQLLVNCFTTSHSVAEVYALDSIVSVFGPIDTLSPTAAARLAGKMRTNLASTWQKPSVQEAAKTKRKEADIRAEVLTGYATAQAFLALAEKENPGHWALIAASAALAHDQNDYRKKLFDTPDFTKNRRLALDAFATAAAAYAAATTTLPPADWQNDVFETWFLASCGACEANRINETTLPVSGESDRIRGVIESMAPEQREWHMSRFANSIMSQLSSVNPAVKYRVLREGLKVAGSHPKASEANSLLSYYQDLTSEIELRAEIDGPDRVGTKKPFGVLVSLRHTREIEREAGGFGRYLQNQNSGGGFFYYNYGRPLENYRDKFEETCRNTLGEWFDVKSVTFESENVQSAADSEYGWRRTPYAYLVLEAKDPKVDMLPQLRLDLDFLDTSGYVVLPIESRRTGLDASAGKSEPRPFTHLAITQILDDRKAARGEITLEIKCSARGLVPDLNAILDTAVAGFRVKSTRDDGVAVSRFDPEVTQPVVISERSWVVTLEPTSEDAGQQFTFPVPKVEHVELLCQRYQDADLVPATATVALGEPALRPLQSATWIVVATAAGGLVVCALAVVGWRLGRRRPKLVPRFVMPEPATPFSVLELLRDIQSNDGLDDRSHADLRASIAEIERRYFADRNAPAPQTNDEDLVAVAGSWVARARRRR